jgi:heme/copper-type cytochrome/quinol oxidase subunit 2
MKRLNIHQLRNWPTEKISSRALYLLVGIAMVVFVLFWLVGFDRPFEDDPNFNAPLFTNVLLVLMVLYLLLGIGFSVWSVVSLLKEAGQDRGCGEWNPREEDRLLGHGWCRRPMLLLTFALGSTAPMKINGATYASSFWLRTSDMFIATSLVMMLVAVAAVIYGATKYNRKL